MVSDACDHEWQHIMRVDATANTYATVAGWEGELYSASAAISQYAGGSQIRYSLDGLDIPSTTSSHR